MILKAGKEHKCHPICFPIFYKSSKSKYRNLIGGIFNGHRIYLYLYKVTKVYNILTRGLLPRLKKMTTRRTRMGN